jgi:hypothetical protein
LASEEDEVRECRVILANIVLQLNLPHKWLWQLHVSKNYDVSSAYNYLMSSDNTSPTDNNVSIWNKEVPLKVSLFAWCLMRNWSPTTVNLNRRHIIQPNVHLCVGRCGIMEDVNHLILLYNFFGKIWYDVTS